MKNIDRLFLGLTRNTEMDLKNDTAAGEGVHRSLELHDAIGVGEDAFGFKEPLNLKGNDPCRRGNARMPPRTSCRTRSGSRSAFQELASPQA